MLSSLDSLPRDALLKIAEALSDDPVSLIRLGLTCREGRFVASQLTHGVCLPAVPRRLNQSKLCAALLLSRQEVHQFPFQVQRTPSYVRNSFDLFTVLPKLLELSGGWAGLKQRLDRTFQKKRKLADMREQQDEALVKRRAMMNDWISKDLPFGEKVTNVEAWEKSLREHDYVDPSGSIQELFRKFLRSASLTAAPLEKVKELALFWERRSASRLAAQAQ